ncbi:MAG: hypothetical protein II430_01410, partial [Selenomonas sp.]|nr:hypothetical protein [Selenomonas sp.]
MDNSYFIISFTLYSTDISFFLPVNSSAPALPIKFFPQQGFSGNLTNKVNVCFTERSFVMQNYKIAVIAGDGIGP